VPWRLTHAAIGLAPPLVVSIVYLTPLVRAIPPLVGLPLALLSFVWMLVYPLRVARRYGWVPRASNLDSRIVLEFFVAVLVVTATWVVLVIGHMIWVTLFDRPLGEPSVLERTARSNNLLLLVVLVVFAVGVAPVTEEVLFRGVMYNALCRYMPRARAMILQAIVFGLLHWPYGAVPAIAIGCMGAVFALVYDLRRTLLAPILCHAFYNATVATAVVLTAASYAAEPTLGLHGTPRENGLIITKVTPGSGAEAAGIRSGDVLYSVNGWGVQNAPHVRAAVRDKKPGETVTVEFIRDDQVYRTEVLLRARRELPRE
jgi:membrane protease YdiL (CAAX protease family)